VECEYGCGEIARYHLRSGKHCCSTSYQSCSAVKAKNGKGVAKAHADGRILGFNDADRIKSNEVAIEEAIAKCFVEDSSYTSMYVKRWLYTEFGYEHRCSECEITEWNGKYITLELDHVNGNNRDNRLQNLRLLCPNCHSLTPTWRGRNINNGERTVSDKDLIAALNECANIRQALLKVGLAAKGANYIRAKKLSGSDEIGKHSGLM